MWKLGYADPRQTVDEMEKLLNPKDPKNGSDKVHENPTQLIHCQTLNAKKKNFQEQGFQVEEDRNSQKTQFSKLGKANDANKMVFDKPISTKKLEGVPVEETRQEPLQK